MYIALNDTFIVFFKYEHSKTNLCHLYNYLQTQYITMS